MFTFPQTAPTMAGPATTRRPAEHEEDPQPPLRLCRGDARGLVRAIRNFTGWSRARPGHRAGEGPLRARSASSPAAARATCRCSPAMSGQGCSTPAPSATSSPRRPPSRWRTPCGRPISGAGVLRLYGNYGGDVHELRHGRRAGRVRRYRDHAPCCCADDVASRARRRSATSGAASPAWSSPSRSPGRPQRRASTSPR